MDNLFWHFWWLLFPIGFMALGVFRSWLDYRARRDVAQVLRELAAAGQEPPAALINRLR